MQSCLISPSQFENCSSTNISADNSVKYWGKVGPSKAVPFGCLLNPRPHLCPRIDGKDPQKLFFKCQRGTFEMWNVNFSPNITKTDYLLIVTMLLVENCKFCLEFSCINSVIAYSKSILWDIWKGYHRNTCLVSFLRFKIDEQVVIGLSSKGNLRTIS